MVRVGWVLGELGLWRLERNNPGPPPAGFSIHDWEAITALRGQPNAIAARMKETPLRYSAAEVRRATSVGDIPLIVISPGPNPADPTYAQKMSLQAALANLSRRGRQIILPSVRFPIPYENSSNMVLYESPGPVVDAIREVISEAGAGHRN